MVRPHTHKETINVLYTNPHNVLQEKSSAILNFFAYKYVSVSLQCHVKPKYIYTNYRTAKCLKIFWNINVIL